jgi:hypothetical protein
MIADEKERKHQRIVNQHINLLPFLPQTWHEPPHLLRRTNIQLNTKNLHSIPTFLLNILLDLFQGINSPRSEN